VAALRNIQEELLEMADKKGSFNGHRHKKMKSSFVRRRAMFISFGVLNRR